MGEGGIFPTATLEAYCSQSPVFAKLLPAAELVNDSDAGLEHSIAD